MGNRADGKFARGLAALLVFGALLGAGGGSSARGEQPAAVPTPQPRTAPAGAAAAAQPPVKVQADRAEYFNAESKVIFTGKVKATQGDATLTAERMEVVFSPEAPAGGEGAKPAEAQSRIRSIVATQNVTFHQVDAETKKERYGVGERGEYDAATKVMTLTGNPRVWEGKNVMTGEKMLFFLESHRVQVEGKVNLTVYPEDSPRPREQNRKP
jgi:lipopolysaccharide export system protein LptA